MFLSRSKFDSKDRFEKVVVVIRFFANIQDILYHWNISFLMIDDTHLQNWSLYYLFYHGIYIAIIYRRTEVKYYFNIVKNYLNSLSNNYSRIFKIPSNPRLQIEGLIINKWSTTTKFKFRSSFRFYSCWLSSRISMIIDYCRNYNFLVKIISLRELQKFSNYFKCETEQNITWMYKSINWLINVTVFY